MKNNLKILLASMTIATAAFAAPVLKQDSNLTVKTLPNGTTIAVCKNAEPPNRVSMRLVVRRGSAVESESERGLAHFIEHMAFNGTKHFPSGEMVEYFQRLGMAFGADSNAYTSFDETVFMLDIPEVSKKLVDDGLMLLRDYADGILFEQPAIEKERGVIVAEKNARDNQEYRKAVKEIAHSFKGSIFAKRMPIGEESVIKSANAPDFKKFYRETYRPENCIVVIAGDIDPQKTLAEAEKYFSDFNAPDAPARKVDAGTLEKSDFKFDFSDALPPLDTVSDGTPNTPRSYAAITVSEVPESRLDTVERRAEDFRIKTISAALISRFMMVADKPESKINQGTASNFEFEKFCDSFVVNVEAPVGKSRDALVEAFRQLLSFGNVSDAEIANAKKKIFELLESAIKARPTTKSASLANSIAGAIGEDAVFTSPENDLEIAKYALENFDAKAAAELLAKILSGKRFKIFLSDNVEIAADKLDATVASAFAEASKSRRAASEFAQSGLKFSDFGAAGETLSHKTIADIGAEQVEFKNGVRLNVKKTDFAKDEVLFKISFGNGVLDIPADKPEYFAATQALVAGGTKFQTVGEINAAKYALKMGVRAGIDGNSFFVAGGSSTADFAQAVKLAATYFADAGFRPDGSESLQKYAEEFYLDYRTDPREQLRLVPMKLFGKSLPDFPGKIENFRKIKMSEIEKWLKPILEKSYLEISIVGDVDADAAIKLVAETFGTLPNRASKKHEAFADLKPLPEGSSFDLHYETTDEPRAVAMSIWLTSGRDDARAMRADNVLGSVFDDVLRKDVREGSGKVYSPFAYNSSSIWLKSTGFLFAGSMVEPKFCGDVSELIDKCAQKTKSKITEDEFGRAKIPLQKQVEAQKRTNRYWLDAVLDLSQCKPENIELARTIDRSYAEIGIDAVRERARKVFSQKPYTVRIMPRQIKKELKK